MKAILFWPVRSCLALFFRACSPVTFGGGTAPRSLPVSNLQAPGGGGEKNTNRACDA